MVLTIGAVAWLGWSLQGLLALSVASVVMLAPLWVGGSAVIVLTSVAVVYALVLAQPLTIATAVYYIFYPTVSVVGFSLAVPLAAVLVRTAAEVRQSQLELAQQGVTAERVRVARDLHDLIGQTFTAVSLKGELALRLLSQRPAAARTEVAYATDLCGRALHRMRDLAHHRPAASLTEEARNALELLTAAGVRATIAVPDQALPAPVEEVMAWAVREGITNVLQHSTATEVDLVLTTNDSSIRLVLRNDGTPEGPWARSGLNGLAERAAAVGGHLTASRHHGEFVLTIEMPGGEL